MPSGAEDVEGLNGCGVHRDPDEFGLQTITVADNDGRHVALISWAPDSGTIDRIHVTGDLQRRGIATELWNRARARCPHPGHDDIDELTPDGHAWARAIGGPNAPV